MDKLLSSNKSNVNLFTYTQSRIELTIQQTKNSNNPKLKQQALDLERRIQEKENAKLQKEIQKN